MAKVNNVIEQYRGFEIDHFFRIYKSGKHVFSAHWQICNSIEEAKNIINNSLLVAEQLNNYQERQLNKYGNILPEPIILPDGTCELENGQEDADRFSEWINEVAQQQLLEYEQR